MAAVERAHAEMAQMEARRAMQAEQAAREEAAKAKRPAPR
jgi:hypothetical protein